MNPASSGRMVRRRFEQFALAGQLAAGLLQLRLDRPQPGRRKQLLGLQFGQRRPGLRRRRQRALEQVLDGFVGQLHGQTP